MPTPQQRLDAALEAWNAGDLDGYLELYDERIRLHGYAPQPMSKREVRGFYQQVHAAFDHPRLAFHEVLWDGDACTIRFTLHGRHTGEFLGVPATGTEIAQDGITILHFDGDRVVERWSQADMLGLLVQIGAMPGRRRTTVDEMLAAARARLRRVGPEEALAAQRAGALLLDIRSERQREQDGVIPGAPHHPRNVLEWRADPGSGHSDPALAGDLDRQVIVVCDEGYQSSLVAATLQDLGYARATDLDGGFQAWRAAGLAVSRLARSP